MCQLKTLKMRVLVRLNKIKKARLLYKKTGLVFFATISEGTMIENVTLDLKDRCKKGGALDFNHHRQVLKILTGSGLVK